MMNAHDAVEKIKAILETTGMSMEDFLDLSASNKVGEAIGLGMVIPIMVTLCATSLVFCYRCAKRAKDEKDYDKRGNLEGLCVGAATAGIAFGIVSMVVTLVFMTTKLEVLLSPRYAAIESILTGL